MLQVEILFISNFMTKKIQTNSLKISHVYARYYTGDNRLRDDVLRRKLSLRLFGYIDGTYTTGDCCTNTACALAGTDLLRPPWQRISRVYHL